MKWSILQKAFMVSLCVCLLSAFLGSCGWVETPAVSTEPASSTAAKPTEEEEIILRVLVEESLGAAMGPAGFDYLHSYLTRYVSMFQSSHKDVEVVIEKLPKTEGRKEVLQRLRTELMMGEGPDILLLPTLPTITETWDEFVEPLIPDVQMAMRNGLFLDISAYYDADTKLNTQALNSTVMDAGILDGARYVLPLSYNLPVACVIPDAFAESGIPQDIFTYGASDLMNAVAQMEDLKAVGNFYHTYNTGAPLAFNFFPQLLDYDTGKVALTQEELAAYLWAWQSYRAQTYKVDDAGGTWSKSYDLHFYDGSEELGFRYWAEEGHFASCDSLLLAADNLLLAKRAGLSLDMYPMRAVDGSVVADVTLYCAVTSGCEHPELAYDFMREFLGENYQWQLGYTSGIDFYGWPVRTEGSVAPTCNAVRGSGQKNPANELNITDSDMPVLNVGIDHVRFSIPLEVEFGKEFRKLINQTTGGAFPTDIDQLAADWIKKLQQHLDEG